MLSPFELVQFDTEAEEPVRDNQGFCVPVGPGTRIGKPSLGVGRAGAIWSLAGTAAQSLEVSAQWWCLLPSPRLTTAWDPLPLSFSALPGSSASISCFTGSLGVHLWKSCPPRHQSLVQYLLLGSSLLGPCTVLAISLSSHHHLSLSRVLPLLSSFYF